MKLKILLLVPIIMLPLLLFVQNVQAQAKLGLEVSLDAMETNVPKENESMASCTPTTPASNPLVVAFAQIKDQFPNLRTMEIHPSRTTNCLPSVAILVTEQLMKDQKEIFLKLGQATFAGMHNPTKQIEACNPAAATFASCCQGMERDNFNWACLAAVGTPPLDPPLWRLWGAEYVLMLFGAEMGRESVAIRQNNVVGFPGDQILFIWPYFVDDNGVQKIVSTTITGKMLNRLSAGTFLSRDSLAFIFGKSFPPGTVYNCGVGQPWMGGTYIPNASASINVSSNDASDIRMPVSAPTNIVTTIQGQTRHNQFGAVGLRSSGTTPIGGSNRAWLDFAEKVRATPGDPFPCFPVIGKAASNETISRLFNGKDQSLFLFNTIYLSALWEGYIAKPRVAQSVKPDFVQLRQKAMANYAQAPPPLCEKLCMEGDPKCLFVNYRKSDADGGLKRLYKELLRPLPFEISPARLGEIFNMQGDPSLKLRESTFFVPAPAEQNIGAFQNHGDECLVEFISSQYGKELRTRLYFPQDISGHLAITSNEIRLLFGGLPNMPVLSFSEQTADAFWGGRVMAMNSDGKSMILTTERGCIQAPLVPTDAAVFKKRLAKTVATLGLQSIKKHLQGLLMFGNGDWQIGGGAPPLDKPWISSEIGTGCPCGGAYGYVNNPFDHPVNVNLREFWWVGMSNVYKHDFPETVGARDRSALGCITVTHENYICGASRKWDILGWR